MKELGFAFSINVVLHRANLDRIGAHHRPRGRAGRGSAGAGQHPVLRLGPGEPRDADADPGAGRARAGDGAGGHARATRARCRSSSCCPTTSSSTRSRVTAVGASFYLVVAPDGKVLPCHGATQITTLTFDNVAGPLAGVDLAGVRGLQGISRGRLDAGALPELPAQDGRLRRLPLPGLRAHRRGGEHRPRLHALSRPGADRRGGGGVERLDGVSLPRLAAEPQRA